jgi:hypothetical protein
MAREIDQGPRAASFILTEADGHMSRENGVAIAGNGRLKAGTVMQASAAFTLSPTGNTTSGSAVVSALSSVAGLVPGRTYAISGAGIPAGTMFQYSSGNSITMSKPATATATGAALTATHAAGMIEPWKTGQAAIGIIIYPADTGGDPAQADLDETAGHDVAVSYIARLAEVNQYQLVYPAGLDAEVAASLATKNILVRG